MSFHFVKSFEKGELFLRDTLFKLYNEDHMNAITPFTTDDVSHIADLAHIPVTEEEKKVLAGGFTTTMAVVENLKKADTSSMEPTHQVTGLTNVMREDVVDEKRMFSQEEALRNAKRTHNGFFVVKQVLEK